MKNSLAYPFLKFVIHHAYFCVILQLLVFHISAVAIFFSLNSHVKCPPLDSFQLIYYQHDNKPVTQYPNCIEERNETITSEVALKLNPGVEFLRPSTDTEHRLSSLLYHQKHNASGLSYLDGGGRIAINLISRS